MEHLTYVEKLRWAATVARLCGCDPMFYIEELMRPDLSLMQHKYWLNQFVLDAEFQTLETARSTTQSFLINERNNP